MARCLGIAPIHILLPAWVTGWYLLSRQILCQDVCDVPEYIPEKPWAHVRVSHRTSFLSGVTESDISPGSLQQGSASIFPCIPQVLTSEC